MNTKKLLPAAAMLMMLAACTQEEITPAVERVPVTLAYTTVDATETRAAQNLNEGTFATGESVKVRISNTGANSWTDYTFTTAAAGAMTAPNPGPYYPAGSQNIDIVAYYPATAGTSFTVATDQTADDSYKASDLMFASVTDQAKQAEAVNLAFSHKMAKLCVNITAGQGVTSITSISILNVKPTVSFNQATGAVGEADGTATSIAISNQGAAVIPAQTIDGGLLEIVTDKGTATYAVENKAFVAGKFYTLNITVNFRAVGTTTTITDWVGEGEMDTYLVLNDMTPAGVEAVDLGGPNGLKWANMNIGAESVTGFGDYFAWGETVPHYQKGFSQENPCNHWIDGLTGYEWANYSMCNGTDASINKYCNDDHRTVLSRNDDAAYYNWGGKWRMPTREEWIWLYNNCTWTWTTQNGVNGYLFKGNDNSIFLPAAGFRMGTSLNQVGSYGYYWSSTLHEPKYGKYVYFFSDLVNADNNCQRFIGLTVRAVMTE